MPAKKAMSVKSPLITRYAHPFFTTAPVSPAVRTRLGASRMSQWISQQLGPIPKPTGQSAMDLAQIIGAQGISEIESAGEILFHSMGDTGRPNGDGPEEEVAAQMTADFSASQSAQNPAFLLHLGDVIYGSNKENLYRDEFYRPYKNYPGKILAVPGNHDGETFPGTDPKALAAFLANFCAKSPVVPAVAGAVRVFRQTTTQPGVYWLLNAPFVQIIGLYSNIAEGPGHLEGANNDQTQLLWLKKTLSTIASARRAGQRSALVIAVHHPPYSNGGHAGSPNMLKQIDDACAGAGIFPDALLSGHAHNYQRYTRAVPMPDKRMQVPFLVAGCGGHNDSAVNPPTNTPDGDHTFVKSRKGFGYLMVKVTAKQLTIQFWPVPKAGNVPFDHVVVDLGSSQIVAQG